MRRQTITEQYFRFRAHAEQVFHMYNLNKHKIFTYTQEVIYGKQGDNEGMPRGGNVSNPTERAAMAIATNRRLAEMEREVKAVDRVLRTTCGPRLKYIRRVLINKSMNEERACEYFGISRRTAVNWKKDACVRLARYLGWLDED